MGWTTGTNDTDHVCIWQECGCMSGVFLHDAGIAVAAHSASVGCEAYPHLTHPSDTSASGGNSVRMRRRMAVPCSRVSGVCRHAMDWHASGDKYVECVF